MENALDLAPGKLHLFIAPRPVGYKLLHLCAVRLALAGPLDVLDGGNAFNVHTLARRLSTRTENVAAALQRICITRAFTCYQIAASLAELTPQPRPLLLMDWLATFSDENVLLRERLRLLDQTLYRLGKLSRMGPVAASISAMGDGVCLARLEARLGEWDARHLAVWRYELPGR